MVVYLRTFLHPAGFPTPPATEIGREAATMVLIFTGAWLFGQNLQQRLAFILTIFSIWDIFYYIWLKVLINWPSSIMDWDVLFLIPVVWASPVLAPVLVSLTMLLFAMIILYRNCCSRALKASLTDWVGFIVSALIIIMSFCIAGQWPRPDSQPYFCWPLFAVGNISAIALFLKCLLSSKH